MSSLLFVSMQDTKKSTFHCFPAIPQPRSLFYLCRRFSFLFQTCCCSSLLHWGMIYFSIRIQLTSESSQLSQNIIYTLSLTLKQKLQPLTGNRYNLHFQYLSLTVTLNWLYLTFITSLIERNEFKYYLKYF